MITVIDIQTGNIASVRRALAHLGIAHRIAVSPEELSGAEKIIFPGVGSFSEAMKRLKGAGLDKVLYEKVMQQKTPILGICLGMQLFAAEGEEGGRTAGLNFIPGRASYLRSGQQGLRLPHIGWNSVSHRDFRIFDGIEPEACFYFVHSYELVPGPGIKIAQAHYGVDFAAAIQKEHIIGVQFHPEKSQRAGLKLLENFCKGIT